MAAQCYTSRIFAVEWGYLSLTHSFPVISENIAISHILLLLETRVFAYIFVTDRLDSTHYDFNHGDVIGHQSTKFSEITQNNGHCAVQGHSRL